MIKNASRIPKKNFIGLYFHHDGNYTIWKIVGFDLNGDLKCICKDDEVTDGYDQFIRDLEQPMRDGYLFCDASGKRLSDGVVFKRFDKFKKYRDRLLSV
jgi:hypothetical protein